MKGAVTYLTMCGMVVVTDRPYQHIVHLLLRYLRLCMPRESVGNN
jgi:hypothetical protein